MTQNMKGHFWQFEYDSEITTVRGCRVVYCYNETPQLINCWDFTHNGFRNFYKQRLQRKKTIPFCQFIQLPKDLTNIKEVLNGYLKENKFAWYDHNTGLLAIINQPTIQNYYERYECSSVKLRINYDNKQHVLFWWEGESMSWFIGLQKQNSDTIDNVTQFKRFDEILDLG